VCDPGNGMLYGLRTMMGYIHWFGKFKGGESWKKFGITVGDNQWVMC
jgi:hypothetical protein